MKILKKLIAIPMIIINILALTNISMASSDIPPANTLYIAEKHEAHVKYWVDNLNIPVVKYYYNGEERFAYDTLKNAQGIETQNYNKKIRGETGKYTIVRAILAGYPYNTPEELGCENEYESYAATQVAVYMAIYGKQGFLAIEGDEQGERIINAANKIFDKSNDEPMKEAKMGQIDRCVYSWEQDEIDSGYISQKYFVKDDFINQINTYKITLESNSNELPNGIKIVDENNQERDTFSSNEIFKVMIPISETKEIGEYKINAKASIQTNKMYDCVSEDGGYNKEYCLLTNSVEEVSDSAIFEYPKNETKIIIENQDMETQEKLKDFGFEILNEQKETVYSNLVTNEEGRIEVENIVPGKYFVKEVFTTEEYELNEELIPIDVNYNDVATCFFDNKKGEKPVTQVDKTNKTLKTKEVQATKNNIKNKKLPITGM